MENNDNLRKPSRIGQPPLRGLAMLLLRAVVVAVLFWVGCRQLDQAFLILPTGESLLTEIATVKSFIKPIHWACVGCVILLLLNGRSLLGFGCGVVAALVGGMLHIYYLELMKVLRILPEDKRAEMIAETIVLDPAKIFITCMGLAVLTGLMWGVRSIFPSKTDTEQERQLALEQALAERLSMDPEETPSVIKNNSSG